MPLAASRLRVQHDAALRKSGESIRISHQTVVSATAYVVVELSILSPETYVPRN